MAKTDDVKWQAVDADTFEGELAKLYARYKAQQKLAKEAREAFEEAFSDRVSLPKGKRLAFGYKFGKLSVAVVDAEKPKGDSKTLSLGDFIEAQERSGRRA